jgi:hypothetical protein
MDYYTMAIFLHRYQFDVSYILNIIIFISNITTQGVVYLRLDGPPPSSPATPLGPPNTQALGVRWSQGGPPTPFLRLIHFGLGFFVFVLLCLTTGGGRLASLSSWSSSGMSLSFIISVSPKQLSLTLIEVAIGRPF